MPKWIDEEQILLYDVVDTVGFSLIYIFVKKIEYEKCMYLYNIYQSIYQL